MNQTETIYYKHGTTYAITVTALMTAVTCIPVSYTHLLVHQINKCAVISPKLFACMLCCSICALAVSYTHLDVYKRQGQHPEAEAPVRCNALRYSLPQEVSESHRFRYTHPQLSRRALPLHSQIKARRL